MLVDNQSECGKIDIKQVLNTGETKVKARNSFTLAILSGILLLLSFPPFDLEFLAWVALIPALVAIYYERQFKRVRWLGIIVMAIVFIPQWFELWYSEMEFFLPASWSWVGYPIAVIVGYLIASVWGEILAYWKPARFPSSTLKHLPAGLWVIILPILWVCVEFLIMNIPLVMKIGGAFGYTSISGTQWRTVPILQLASFTGMYGVTFLIVLVNCALAYAIIRFKDYRGVYIPTIAVILIFVAIFTLGWLSVPPPLSGDVNAAIIQTAEKYEDNPELYADLITKSLKYEPQIVTGATPIDEFTDFSQEHHIYLLDGTEFLSPDGKRSHYDITYHFINIPDGFSPWEPQRIISPPIDGFETEFGEVGSLICMESASPTPTRRLVEGGTQVITTTSMNQGFAIAGLLGGNAVYRAVEFRVPAVSYRAWGGSVIIDPYGRIIEDIAPEEEIVAGKLAFAEGQTFYGRYGDIFGYIIVFLALVLVVYNSYLGRKSLFRYCERCGAEVAKDAEACQQCGASQKKPPLWKRILFHEYYEHIDRHRGPKKPKPK